MADALVPPFLKATLFFVKKTEIARNLNTRLNNLQRKLSTTQAVIRQADQQQTECEVVKNWLNELQDIACDTEKVRVKLERHKIRGGVITRFKIGNKMKNAEERVDAIIKEIVQSEPIAGAVILLTGSFPTESEAYRRDGAPPTTFSRPPTVIPAATTPPQTPAAPMAPTAVTESYVYGQVTTSNLVIEETIQMILDMGGGSWDRDTVVRALRAAYNDPERAVEYLYSGIPVQAEVAPIVARTPPGWQVAYPPPAQATQQVQPARPSSRPNVNPQGIPSMGSNTGAGTLDFLRTSQQFHALRAMVQANPQILQPMLQELGKQNPPLMRLIQEHQADFLRLINEPVERVEGESDVYGQATSNLVTGNSFEETIQYILDFGGGTWDRDTVVWALRAASNNPERAIEYLYYGIPVQAEVASAVARPPPGVQAAYPPPAQATQPAQPAQPAVPSSGPNANPLNLFPQGVPSMGSNTGAGTLDFLRTSQQFQALRAMVQANPQILQPMLQELGKQNPPLMRLIQEHQADFLRLINEPVEGEEGNILGQLASAMPQAVTVTPEEREAIERLEAMGFDRAIVLEVFFACNKNEELAANYLLDHSHEFEE